MYGKKYFLTVASAVIFLATGCSQQIKSGIPAVKELSLERYCGKWYEIARLPNSFERGMSDVYTIYTLQKNGTVKVVNYGRKNGRLHSVSGIARAVENGGGGELEVSFFRPFYGSYRIIKLAPDYSYSVVMGNSRELLWILARSPELTPEQSTEIRDFLNMHRFPVEKLIWRADFNTQ